MDRYCRICRNASCSNHGKDITFLGEGWKCNYVPVPTNADRIRSMSDEELAKILGDKCICPPIGECAKVSGDCEKCWFEWLQQPADTHDNPVLLDEK